MKKLFTVLALMLLCLGGAAQGNTAAESPTAETENGPSAGDAAEILKKMNAEAASISEYGMILYFNGFWNGQTRPFVFDYSCTMPSDIRTTVLCGYQKGTTVNYIPSVSPDSVQVKWGFLTVSKPAAQMGVEGTPLVVSAVALVMDELNAYSECRFLGEDRLTISAAEDFSRITAATPRNLVSMNSGCIAGTSETQDGETAADPKEVLEADCYFIEFRNFDTTDTVAVDKNTLWVYYRKKVVSGNTVQEIALWNLNYKKAVDDASL